MNTGSNKALYVQWLKRVAKGALDVCLPQTCLGCRTVVQTHNLAPTLCAVCWGQLQSADTLRETMAYMAEESAFDSFTAPFLYEGMAMTLVKNLKYGGQRPTARLMAQQMLPYMEAEVDVIVPVPLHKKRLYRRAYNQAGDLAKHLSKISGTPCAPFGLTRVRHTQSQVGQKAEVRRAQLKNAFTADEALKGKRVVLVDDVCTTGSTADACAVALKDAGVLYVQVLTFAFVEPKVGK